MYDALNEPHILRALAAGVGIACVAGVMGCFVVWRRMAYFGDSLSHSALLGVALGIMIGISVTLGVIAVGLGFALLLVWLQRRRLLATDTLLGILAHAALSIGMVALSLMHQSIDVHAYLFGDIFTVTVADIGLIYGGGALVLMLLIVNWSALVLMTVHEDLARAEGVRTVHIQLLFVFMMAVMVAVSVRMVGILLITSMLIMPAATARQFASSPERMALIASLLGALSVVGGMAASVWLDTPAAPSIVSVSAALFAVLLPFALVVQRRS